ncbi:MAG: HD-GYP domain-containing protein [Treponema sp.]|jgi:HD-GYP domain-containing protein (c-di-GMP phosphodiesterase class II)|nr:HD-GYP domain-containing protein [Treponema sp.]
MKKLQLDSLRPGLSFTEAVYIEDENVLVPAGIAVRKKDLERLKAWGVESVETGGEAVRPPGTPELSDPYWNYTGLIEQMNTVFERISAGGKSDPAELDQIVDRLLQLVRAEQTSIIGYVLGSVVKGNPLAKNAVNTAILTALICGEFKITGRPFIQAVTAALLHDAGMLWLSPNIVSKQGSLSESEMQLMRTHPIYSYTIACREFAFPDEMGRIVLQHHERWDGEGYPNRFRGKRIDPWARIISVADAFEAMVSEKSYRNSMIGYQAMKNLLADNAMRFDPDVLKAFIKTMGIYPIGSLVLLNNRVIARVVKVQRDAPLRPRVRILIDQTGAAYNPHEGPLIDLVQEKSLFIARPMEFREIPVKGE